MERSSESYLAFFFTQGGWAFWEDDGDGWNERDDWGELGKGCLFIWRARRAEERLEDEEGGDWG